MSHWAAPLEQLCAVLTQSLTGNQYAKQGLCRHACSVPLCIIFSGSTFSQHVYSEYIWSIHSNFPTNKPSQKSPSHLLTCPLSAVAIPTKASGGWESPLLVGVSITPSLRHHSQISSVKWEEHNPGIIPPSSGAIIRAVGPAYIIIPDICKIRVMLFFHKLKKLKEDEFEASPTYKLLLAVCSSSHHWEMKMEQL